MFTFQDAVSGDGFLAGITLYGRALMVQEDDGKWWMYGVRPAAMAESGQTLPETFANFRKTYTAVLFDIAEESHTFAQFKENVEDFFYQVDATEERRWTTSLNDLRSGTVLPQSPFDQLPRESAESRPPSVGVVRLDKQQRFQSSDNVPDTFVLPAAA